MSEIRDRVRTQFRDILRQHLEAYQQMGLGASERAIYQILSIPELAIVDREAELPDYRMEPYEVHRTIQKAQKDMLKAGWVKEVKE